MRIILIILLSMSLYGNVKQKMYSFYQNTQYEEACNLGHNSFFKHTKDEEYISLYAFSCLKSDYIDRLSAPIALLKFSKDARANSAYFSIILMQKKILYHALIDGYDLDDLNLPTTNYILSKVFNFYLKLGKHHAKSSYLFTDEKDNKLSYKLYLDHNTGITKMVILEIYDSVILRQHIYW